MADKDDILLNSREVAFLLDFSPDTVNEFARRNILPAFKKGGNGGFANAISPPSSVSTRERINAAA